MSRAMARVFSGGKQVKKIANARNCGRVCLFQRTENEKLFTLKTIMANYGWSVHRYILEAVATVNLVETRTVHFA